MKKTSILSKLLFMLMALPMMVACGSDGDGGGSGTGGSSGPAGWYINRSTLVNSADIQQRIKSWDDMTDYEAFYDDGSYWPHHVFVSGYCDDPDYVHLTMHYTGSDEESFIHIIDGQSLYYYSGFLCKQGSQAAKNYDLLYQVNGGSYGKLGYYGNGTYFVYTRDGNNIVIQQGEEKAIFTITGDGLLQNGGGKWTKYDHNKVY